MRFGLIAYPQKYQIITQSAVSRGTRCLKVVWSLLQLAYLHTLFMREGKNLARSCIHAGSSELLPHAYVTRTIISCADIFIVSVIKISLHNLYFII